MRRLMTRAMCGLRCAAPLGMVLLTVLCPAPSRGQGWGGPPPGPPPATAALNIPLTALSAGLHLDAAQQDKIAVIQRDFDAQRRAALPHPPGPPDPAMMETTRAKMDSRAAQAETRIEAALTTSQKASLPMFIKEVDADRIAGIPPALISELDLTTNQKKQIAAIAEAARLQWKTAREDGDRAGFREMMDQRRQTRDKTMAVLTTAQKVKVEQFVQAHHRPRPGGFGPPPGGSGPPPPGGFGPPSDGVGPPPDGFGPPPGMAPPPPDGGLDGDRP